MSEKNARSGGDGGRRAEPKRAQHRRTKPKSADSAAEARGWLLRDIFLAGAVDDAAELPDNRDALESQFGYEVAIDHEMKAAVPDRDLTERCIKTTKLTVVVWTDNSLADGTLLRCAQVAAKRRQLVQIRLSDGRPPEIDGAAPAFDLRRWGLRQDHAHWVRLTEYVRRRAVPTGPPPPSVPRTRVQTFARWRTTHPLLLVVTAVTVVANLQDVIGSGHVIAKLCRNWLEVGDRLWAGVFALLPAWLHINPEPRIRQMLTTWSIVAATFGLIPLLMTKGGRQPPPLFDFRYWRSGRPRPTALDAALFLPAMGVLIIPGATTVLPLFVEPETLARGGPAVANEGIWLFAIGLMVASCITFLVNGHREQRLAYLRDLDRFDLFPPTNFPAVNAVEAAERYQARLTAGFVGAAVLLLVPAVIDPNAIKPAFRGLVGALPLLVSFILLQAAMGARTLLPAAALSVIAAGILGLDVVSGLLLDAYAYLIRGL